MSRIGKKPVVIPAGVTVDIAAGNAVTVKGPKGTLSYNFHPDMILKMDGNVLTVERPDEEHLHKSLHGLTRTLINNMIVGVEKGYSKELDVNGVTVEVPTPNKIIVHGIDKQAVGQFAAEVRGKRPPEPYKGKGIKYTTEVIRRKVGKTGGKK